MRNWWLQFGCFLTGYNYNIMKASSEASAKQVKYTAAILIVALIWGFVGYSFAERYLHLDTWGALAGAAIMVFIVIQIEKQIILSGVRTKQPRHFVSPLHWSWPFWARSSSTRSYLKTISSCKKKPISLPRSTKFYPVRFRNQCRNSQARHLTGRKKQGAWHPHFRGDQNPNH